MLKTFFTQSKPYTVFDASDPKHRKAFYTFKKKNSWGDCNYRFLIEEPYVNLIDCLNHKVLSYYMQKEFDKERNKDREAVR